MTADTDRMDPVLRFFWEGLSEPGWREPLRRIYDTELIYVSSGSYTLKAGDEHWRLHPGSVAIIPPGIGHESFTEQSESTFRHCVHFDWNADFLDRPAPFQCLSYEQFDTAAAHIPSSRILARLPLVAHRPITACVEHLLSQAMTAIREGRPSGEPLLWPILKLLLNSDQGPPTGRGVGGKTERAVLTLKHYIETHYDKDINYEHFCDVTRLSKGHLCQAFARIVGRPPTAYLNRTRLQHAQRLLRDSNMNIAEAACAVGIPDANYFARVFKQHYRITPSDFIAELAPSAAQR